MRIVFRIEDKGALETLERLERNLDRIIRDTLDMSALMVMGKAKENAPVDKGTLRGSITKTNAVRSGRNYIVRVGTNVKYAPYQEFGTGIYAGRGYIYPRRARFLAWRDKSGKWVFARRVRGVKPRRYFGKAVEYFKANMGKVVRILKSNIDKYV